MSMSKNAIVPKTCCTKLSKEELEARSRASFIPILKHQLDELTDEQRLSIINNYCKYCGTKILPCHCNNDE